MTANIRVDRMKNDYKKVETSPHNKSFYSNPAPNIEIYKKVYHWIGEGIRCLFYKKTVEYKGKKRKQLFIKSSEEFTDICLHFNCKEMIGLRCAGSLLWNIKNCSKILNRSENRRTTTFIPHVSGSFYFSRGIGIDPYQRHSQVVSKCHKWLGKKLSREVEMKLILNHKISSNHPLKKNTKKSHVSNSSRDIIVPAVKRAFDGFYALGLVGGKWKKWSFEKVLETVSTPRFTDCKDPNMLKMRIQEVLEPFRGLEKWLSRTSYGDTLREYLDFMFGAPFTIRLVLNEYPNLEGKEFGRDKKRIQRIVDKLISVNLLEWDTIHNEKWSLPYCRRQRNTIFYYIPSYHDDDMIRAFVIGYYYRFAVGLGIRADKVKKNTKKEGEEGQKQEKRAKRDFTNICDICGVNLTGIKSYYYEKIKVCNTCYKQKKHREFKR